MFHQSRELCLWSHNEDQPETPRSSNCSILEKWRPTNNYYPDESASKHHRQLLKRKEGHLWRELLPLLFKLALLPTPEGRIGVNLADRGEDWGTEQSLQWQVESLVYPESTQSGRLRESPSPVSLGKSCFLKGGEGSAFYLTTVGRRGQDTFLCHVRHGYTTIHFKF